MGVPVPVSGPEEPWVFLHDLEREADVGAGLGGASGVPASSRLGGGSGYPPSGSGSCMCGLMPSYLPCDAFARSESEKKLLVKHLLPRPGATVKDRPSGGDLEMWGCFLLFSK